MRENLTWFYSPTCHICTDMLPHVLSFAQEHDMAFVPVNVLEHLIEDDAVLVPAIAYKHYLLAGSFCLEALKWHHEHVR